MMHGGPRMVQTVRWEVTKGLKSLPLSTNVAGTSVPCSRIVGVGAKDLANSQAFYPSTAPQNIVAFPNESGDPSLRIFHRQHISGIGIY